MRLIKAGRALSIESMHLTLHGSCVAGCTKMHFMGPLLQKSLHIN